MFFFIFMAVGIVESVTAGELVIRSPRWGSSVVPRAELRRLEVSEGRSSGKGAVVGLAVGAAVGAALGLWYKAALEETESAPAFAAVPLIGAGLCGVTGAGVGALVGKEAWREVSVAGVSRAVPVATGGIRLQLTLRL
jgi:hypothetical protein